ncbi:hypothetical protein MMC18_007923 [Xylographa bjoerkii]|nr:hypothetical protein [Xylographa bjoerkii]
MATSELRYQPLDSLLDVEQCIEMTILVARTTERMHSAIAEIFNASQSPSLAPWEKEVPEGSYANPENPNSKTNTATITADEEAVRRQAQREEELSAHKLQKLRNAAFSHFDQWQDSVIMCFGKIIKTDAEALQAAPITEPSLASPIAPSKPAKPQTTHGLRANAELRRLYPPIDTSLLSITEDVRTSIINSALLLLLSLEQYTSYSRILLLRLASSLDVPVHSLNLSEVRTARSLLEAAQAMSGAVEAAARAESSKNARRWKVGFATVAGAALIGVTGGLAAPLVAAGIGGVLGGIGLGGTAVAGILTTLSGSGVLVGSLFGAYGGRMTGEMMDAYAKEVSDFAFLSIHDPGISGDAKQNRRLRVTIGVSGWLENDSEVLSPWRGVGGATEVFALRWELEALLELGSALRTMITSFGMNFVAVEIIKRTVLASLWAALWPYSLLRLARLVDNPFSVALSRSEKAGVILADALIAKTQGARPVTLIGYSLGARVIYSCLLFLASRHAFGLIENVILLGSPTPSTAAEWRVMRTVVTGRLVNVYSENDFILAFLYRAGSIQRGVAGLQRVEGVRGVENVDVSARVSGHLKYRSLVGSILEEIGWESVNAKEVAKERQALRKMEEKEEVERKEVKRKEVERKEEEDQEVGEELSTSDVELDAKVIGSEADWEALVREAMKEATESREKGMRRKKMLRGLETGSWDEGDRRYST